jgi:RNA polymerase sigma factor (sigma-70 family)
MLAGEIYFKKSLAKPWISIRRFSHQFKSKKIMETQDFSKFEVAFEDFAKDPTNDIFKQKFFMALISYYSGQVAKLCSGNQYGIMPDDVFGYSVEKITKVVFGGDSYSNVAGYISTILKHTFYDLINREINHRAKIRYEIDESSIDRKNNTSEEEEDWLSSIATDPVKRLEKAKPPLTKREREVLQLRVKGMKYEEIAVMLRISRETVQNTVYKAKKKLPKGR